ncbi:hypothetical protein GCM10023191_057550 [Actinoallomurus oryzae]|uniref:Uncharacterized protein n=1 Tax=Actinoallomurus oryzae TaxID=502180 RepID=A0ABP8QKI8_9ACTN
MHARSPLTYSPAVATAFRPPSANRRKRPATRARLTRPPSHRQVETEDGREGGRYRDELAGLPYTSGSLAPQTGSVYKRILRLALPDPDTADPNTRHHQLRTFT